MHANIKSAQPSNIMVLVHSTINKTSFYIIVKKRYFVIILILFCIQYIYNKYQSYYRVEMQPQPQQRNQNGRMESRIIETMKLKNCLKEPKDTIFLYTLSPSLKQSISAVAHWLLGGTITYINQCQYDIKEVPAIKSIKAGVAIGGLQYHVVENQNSKLRVIACYVPEQIKDEQVSDLLYFFTVLQDMVVEKGKKVKFLTAVDASQKMDTINKNLSNSQKLLFKKDTEQKDPHLSSIGIVYCEPKHQFDSSKTTYKLRISKQNPKSNEQTKQLFCDHTKNLQIQKIIENKLQSGVIGIFQKLKEEVDAKMIALVKPMNYIVYNFLYKNVIEFNNLFSVSLISFNRIQVQVSQLIDDQVLINSVYKKNIDKNDKQSALIKLAFRSWEIINDFGSIQKKKNTIQWLRDFYSQILKEISQLPEFMNQENNTYLRKYRQLLIQQTQIFQKISPNYCIPNIASIFDAIKIKENNIYVSQDSLLLKITVKVLSSPLARGKNLDYYTLINKLVNSCFQKIKIDGLKEKQMLKKNKKKYDQNLPMYKIEGVLAEDNNQKQQLIEIKAFYKKFESLQANMNQLDFSLLLSILKKSGQKLIILGYPELALEVFKKIKLEFNICQCINEIIMKNGYRSNEFEHTKISELYTKTAEYFLESNRVDKFMEFTQLAYQTTPFEAVYLKNLIEAEKKILANKVDHKAWLTTLSTIDDKNLTKYFTYMLPQTFYSEIQKIQFKKDQIDLDTTYEITRKTLGDNSSIQSLILGLSDI